MDNVKEISLGNNITLTLIKESKFKSNLVSVYIQRVLDKNEVTKNALLPMIITSGSEKYQSTTEISDELDYLYGSSMGADISKRGERQVLSFKIISTNERYLDEKIFKNVIEFLNEIINKPLVVDGGFSKEYLDIEKQNLKDKIQSKINDKGRYALDRCLEEMCKDEPYSIDEYGYEEDIDKIDGKSLYNHYLDILKTSPIDIVVEGDFDEKEVEEIISNNFKFKRDNIIDIPRAQFRKEVKEVKVIEESMDIIQGKLVMAYRANVDYKENDKYYPLVVASNILGGGPHSKMFVNIREKESLCYYIYSSVEKYKSIMFVSSGIEFKNYDKTVELVKEQLKSVQEGHISEDEINNSKMALVNSMKSIKDSIGGKSDFHFAQAIGGTNMTIEEMIYQIEKVTIDEIIEATKNIELDTVYFLKN